MSPVRLRLARVLTAAIIPLAAVAAAGGLLRSDLYRDAPGVLPAMKGQDLVTLLSSLVLALALGPAARGSSRAVLVWIGLLGYLGYVYTGAAFAYRFNLFFLLYLVLFSATLFALVGAISAIDVRLIHRSFDHRTPRQPVAVFLFLVAILLAVSELGQIIPALLRGNIPELILRSEWLGNFVYVLDLGVVVPLALLAVLWLLRLEPWGDVLAGILLIKAATMGLALLTSTWFSVQAGMPLERGLTTAYAGMAAAATALSVSFLRHCRS